MLKRYFYNFLKDYINFVSFWDKREVQMSIRVYKNCTLFSNKINFDLYKKNSNFFSFLKLIIYWIIMIKIIKKILVEKVCL